VHILEDGVTYACVGALPDSFVTRLNWPTGNVWMPDHAITWVSMRHAVLNDPARCAGTVITNADSIHIDSNYPDYRYFILEADPLRSVGLLTSRSTRFVDAVVE
jgi:hypothetical protein